MKVLVKGCALLRLGAKVDTIRDTLENNEQFDRCLGTLLQLFKIYFAFPLKLLICTIWRSMSMYWDLDMPFFHHEDCEERPAYGFILQV